VKLATRELNIERGQKQATSGKKQQFEFLSATRTIDDGREVWEIDYRDPGIEDAKACRVTIRVASATPALSHECLLVAHQKPKTP
jgi:hypothetical protein